MQGIHKVMFVCVYIHVHVYLCTANVHFCLMIFTYFLKK